MRVATRNVESIAICSVDLHDLHTRATLMVMIGVICVLLWPVRTQYVHCVGAVLSLLNCVCSIICGDGEVRVWTI